MPAFDLLPGSMAQHDPPQVLPTSPLFGAHAESAWEVTNNISDASSPDAASSSSSSSSANSSSSSSSAAPANASINNAPSTPHTPKVVSPNVAYSTPPSGGIKHEPLDNKEENTAGLLFAQPVRSVTLREGAGHRPSPRFGHTAVVYKDNMVVFGGRDTRCNDELWTYEFTTRRWKQVRDGDDGSEGERESERPRARAGHTAVVLNEQFMFIFGGVAEHPTTGSHSCWLNDLWVLNLETFKWSPLRSRGGLLPARRKGHTAVAYRNSMFVFGGGQDDLTLNNDLWEFNHVTKKWIPRRYTGHRPQERMYHVTALSGSRMLVFGGRAVTKDGFFSDIFEINLASFVCRQLWATGPAPTHRMCSTATCHNGVFAVFTGGNYAYLTDSYQLDLRKMQWTRLGNVSFGGRTRPTTVRWNNTLLTFGGCVEGKGYANDYIEVVLEPLSLKAFMKHFIVDRNIEVDTEDLPDQAVEYLEA